MTILLPTCNCLCVSSECTLSNEQGISLLSVACLRVSVPRTFIGSVETFVLFGARVLMAKKILLRDVQVIYQFLKLIHVAKNIRRTNSSWSSSDFLFRKPDFFLFVAIFIFHHWDQGIDALEKSLQRCAIFLIGHFTTIIEDYMGEKILNGVFLGDLCIAV